MLSIQDGQIQSLEVLFYCSVYFTCTSHLYNTQIMNLQSFTVFLCCLTSVFTEEACLRRPCFLSPQTYQLKLLIKPTNINDWCVVHMGNSRITLRTRVDAVCCSSMSRQRVFSSRGHLEIKFLRPAQCRPVLSAHMELLIPSIINLLTEKGAKASSQFGLCLPCPTYGFVLLFISRARSGRRLQEALTMPFFLFPSIIQRGLWVCSGGFPALSMWGAAIPCLSPSPLLRSF